jgi:hypothetical protein
VVVTVVWQRDGSGLRGEVVVENVGGRACRLAGKPSVTPLDEDGQRLGVDTMMTLEARLPDHVDIQPGQRAAAPVSWRNWCGATPSRQALVAWRGGSAVAGVDGPVRPECDELRPGNLTSSWFDPRG